MFMPLSLVVNETTYSVEVDPERTLLSVLRDEIGLTGTKYGCGEGKCGACTVLVDGSPVQSCQMTVGAATDSQVLTIEGVERHGVLHPLQEAFLDAQALQCGYCTPGMIMSALALTQSNPHPTNAELIQFMRDHICRCGSYQRIVAAIANYANGKTQEVQPALAQPLQAQGAQLSMMEATGGEMVMESQDEKIEEGIFVAYACPDLAMRLAA